MERVPDLTRDLMERILRTVRETLDFDTVTAEVGVSREVIFKWLNRGVQESSGIFREFSDEVWKINNDPNVLRALGEKKWQNTKKAILRDYKARIEKAHKNRNKRQEWILKRVLKFLGEQFRAMEKRKAIGDLQAFFNLFVDLESFAEGLDA